MKNIVVAIILVAVFTLGFYFGAVSMNRAPKWVIAHGGLYSICTEYMGNIYEADAYQEYDMYMSYIRGKINK